MAELLRWVDELSVCVSVCSGSWRRARSLPACERPATQASSAAIASLRAAIRTGSAIAVEHTRQIFSCIRTCDLGDRFRRPGPDDLAAAAAAFRSEIDDPIRGLDDFEIVLDDDDRAPCINQTAESRQEFADVIKMQARCRLVENIKQAALEPSFAS